MLRTWSVGIHKSHTPNIISTYKLSEIKLDVPLEICSPKKQAILQIIIQKKHCFNRGLPVYYSQTLGLINTFYKTVYNVNYLFVFVCGTCSSWPTLTRLLILTSSSTVTPYFSAIEASVSPS